MVEEEKLGDKIDKLTDAVKESLDKKKSKGMGLPFKMKTHMTRNKLKKGYVIVQEVHDNRQVNFRKEPIVDNTVKLDDTYHAIRDLDIFLYRNKPMIIQPKKRLNPYNPFMKPLQGKNQTYGQSYVKARMIGDVIKQKPQLKMGAIVIGLLVIGGIIYLIANGGF